MSVGSDRNQVLLSVNLRSVDHIRECCIVLHQRVIFEGNLAEFEPSGLNRVFFRSNRVTGLLRAKVELLTRATGPSRRG